jgi:hypothetical protein
MGKYTPSKKSGDFTLFCKVYPPYISKDEFVLWKRKKEYC